MVILIELSSPHVPFTGGNLMGAAVGESVMEQPQMVENSSADNSSTTPLPSASSSQKHFVLGILRRQEWWERSLRTSMALFLHKR